MTIRPKFRILLINSFFSERPFNQNLGLPLIYFFFHLQSTIRQKYKIFSFCTTIRPKIRFLINSIFLFAHGHSTKIRSDTYSLIYFFINCANILFALFVAVLPLHFVSYMQSSTPATFIFRTLYCFYIFRTLYPWLYEVSAR